jgi:(p)ppGpp synthase/HD superfamily hydrolase
MILRDKAKAFAIAAHSAIGQTRKYTHQPYWVHPIAVAQLVESVDHTDEMVAAAYLHDVVEDTKVTLELIRDEFGDVVGDLVYWLTDVSCKEDGNRATRKKLDREHISRASADAKTVKLADIISNVIDIKKNDPDFAKVYVGESKILLDVLADGNITLYTFAKQLLYA